MVDTYAIHDRVVIAGSSPGEERGLATIEGGPLRTAVGVVKWLVRPLGASHAVWVAEWALSRP